MDNDVGAGSQVIGLAGLDFDKAQWHRIEWFRVNAFPLRTFVHERVDLDSLESRMGISKTHILEHPTCEVCFLILSRIGVRVRAAFECLI